MDKRVLRFEDETRPNHKAKIRYRYKGTGKFAVRRRKRQAEAIERQRLSDQIKGGE